MNKIISTFATLILTLVIAVPAFSAEKAGVILLDSQMVGSDQLVLNGIALREKFVFDVYVAGLYLPEKATNAEAILANDSPRMMVMHFVRDVEAKSINEAWFEGLKDNTPDFTPELKAKFDQLANMMVDIKENEALGFTYTPTTGTDIMVAGQSKGGIPGKDFADAILATWIGPKPGPGKKFKAALLGQ